VPIFVFSFFFQLIKWKIANNIRHYININKFQVGGGGGGGFCPPGGPPLPPPWGGQGAVFCFLILFQFDNFSCLKEKMKANM